ncbi:MAG: 4Fe-4S dicluster domain-containing protein [Anaerosomatales bacterium]|nr:4Fe-4S dicluster domain-containing protein [Anaerosomatales bacterium]
MADTDKNASVEQDSAAQAGVSRRQFLTGFGGLGVGVVLGGSLFRGFLLPDEVVAIPASDGYLLVDSKKCQGCNTCMMACSLTHHGVQSLSLSRIQVVQDPFVAFPEDKSVLQCRQCPHPACVEACPTKAMHVDSETGVRTVDAAKCIGCQECVNACPFDTSRVVWNTADKHAQKCDLCKDTPFWNETGGADGKRACEQVCPVGAISFTTEIPLQSNEGYEVNLRDAGWAKIGYPIDDEGKINPATASAAH